MMEERTEMRKTLSDHRSGTKLAYLDSLQELVSSQKDLELQTSHVREIEASIAGATAKLAEIKAEFHRSLLNDLAEATRKAAGLAQDVAKSEQRTKYQVLTAPIDGTVQQLAVHSIGGVVTPAQNLLSIVPADSTLEIEAMVDNQDIGFVHIGQDTAIKVDTFSFTRYGLRHGRVVTVSQDAIPRETSGKPAAAQGVAEESSSASYAARVSLDQSQMQIDDRMVNLSPGMAVTVEIKTGRRRIRLSAVAPAAPCAGKPARALSDRIKKDAPRACRTRSPRSRRRHRTAPPGEGHCRHGVTASAHANASGLPLKVRAWWFSNAPSRANEIASRLRCKSR
jgi:hemolysin D